MKKTLMYITIIMMILCISGYVFAADEYSFELSYDGTIVKNIEKDAKVLLVGINGTLHTNVQIKVEVTGPATPKLLATDTSGVEHDIAQLGYWGPPTGFPVQGSFTNTTPIKATFIEEGSYTIKLSLVDLANSNAVITTRTFNIEVYEDETPAENNTVNNTVNNIENNMVEELPKTGTSIWEYVMYIGIVTIILTTVGIYLNRKKIKQNIQ